MKSRSQLFSLWAAEGHNKVIRVSHKPDIPINQGYPSKVKSYSFQEE